MYTAAVVLLLLIQTSIVAIMAADYSQRGAFLCGLCFAFVDVVLVIALRALRKLDREAESLQMLPCNWCLFPTARRHPATMAPQCLACAGKPSRRAI